MKLPLKAKDVKAVVDEAIGLTRDANESVSASLYIDDEAPADLVAHVRSVFAGAAAQARVTIGYLSTSRIEAEPTDDFAVIVAGLGMGVGAAAAALRADGVPVMVVTTMPLFVEAIARESGYPVPEGDVVSPATEGLAVATAASEASRGFAVARRMARDEAEGSRAVVDDNDVYARAAAEADDAVRTRAALDAAFAAEPYALDRASASLLDCRMGEWVVEAARDKRLSMARAFPFVRRPLALDAVNVTAVQNAGIGLVPFLPGADFPLMTINQAKMVLQIATAYGEPMDAGRAREVIGVVAGAFACRSLARTVAGAVPALGWAVRAAIGYAGTAAMGRAAIECFECGGGVKGLAGAIAHAGEAAARIVSEESGGASPAKSASEAARAWAARAGDAAGAIAEVAGPIARRAARAGADSFAAGVASIARGAAESAGRRES